MMSAPGWLKEAGCGLLDLFYPPRCVVCREPGPERFCRECRAGIVPAASLVSAGSSLDGRACVGAYEGPLRDAVIRLKFEDRRALAQDLGRLLAQCLEEWRETWQPDALVPVPIHPQRRRERGYNQAELLAAAMSERCGLPVREALERAKNTLPQVGLGGKERRENIRGAFKPRMGAAPGRRPVLIDDVETSRSTLEEAARSLRAAGAHTVFALTVCWDRPAPGSDDGQRPPGDRGSLPYARGS
jgi:competence protein ComFC